MEASTSRPPVPSPNLRAPQPQTPSHPSLLPAISPSALEATPAPLHTLPPQFHHQPPPPQGRAGPSGQHPNPMAPPNGMHQHPHQMHQQQQQQQQQHPHPHGQPQQMPMGMMLQGNVFGQVMGNAPGQVPVPPPSPGGAPAKVYASVYSGIPVFEAMIRGISVMRRTSDSWVNATQILKVAGIPKSARTKILEKEILTGVHEKVQGGYGKYQGTWIPFLRGQELAAQYGVTQYLAPIFDFIPSPTNVAALPVIRHGTPDRKTPAMNPLLSARTPAGASGSGRIYSPLSHSTLPPPPQFNGEPQLGLAPHPSGMAYPHMFYQPRGVGMEMTPSRSTDALQPAADINGFGLPPSRSDMYIDQFGQPHMSFDADVVEPPAKRQKSEELYPNREEVVEDDDESVDEIRDAPPLPSSMRLSTKPLRPKPTVIANRTRGKLIALFSNDQVNLREELGLGPDDIPTEFDIDMVIDSQGHSTLHWACALAKLPIVAQLIDLGADIHRGNYAGETPLIRSVLTTNHAEAGTFAQLLEHLAPSIRTLDHAYRTVIHHVALIAGVKGRAASARAYMAGVLEYVAKEHREVNGNSPSLSLKTLVDVQDVHGDTALNVAARVGNKGLVTLLVEAGADKAKTNKLGLKPGDFGVEQEVLKVNPADAVVSNLKSEVPKPERQSRDVQKNISAIFETINETFTNEMLAKQTKLNATEASVRHATRALADKRQQVQRAQAALSEMEQVGQRVENVKRALGAAISDLEWTGRTMLANEMQPPPSFRLGEVGHAGDVGGEEIPLPERGEEGALVRLRRIAMWEDRVADVLEDRMRALQGESADKAVKYRRLVSLCTKVPVDKVDGMLDGLVTAIESDGQSIDLSRISGFMSRMKDQAA